MLKYLLIFLFFYFGLNTYLFSQLFTFQNFNHKQGLNLSDISSIEQDENGYLWVGTEGAGIQKFDGIQFITPKNIGGQDEHHVSNISIKKNDIYFSSRYAGYYKFSKNKYQRIEFPVDYLGEFYSIIPFENNYVLIGNLGIRLCNQDKIISTYNFKNSISKAPIQIVEHQSHLFILFDQEALVVFNNKIHTLNTWLEVDKKVRFSFISKDNEALHFYDPKTNKKYSIKIDKYKEKSQIRVSNFLHPKMESIKSVFIKNDKLILVDSLNHFFYIKEQKLTQIPINYKEKNLNINSVFIDKNDDFWACSSNLGLIKISQEPISKIQLHSVYQNPLISFIYRNEKNEVFISDFNGKTYTGTFRNKSFTTFSLRIYGQCTYQNKIIFASNHGLVFYEKGVFKPFLNIKEKVIFIFSVNDKLFYCIDGKGLYEFSKNKTKHIVESGIASHFYTAQFNPFKNKIYFGSNIGLFVYSINDNSIIQLKKITKYPRGYSGVSVKDKFNNYWFSSGKSLIFISKEEKYKFYKDNNLFNSNLFYTLNSDKTGHLWLGTNKGLNRIKINNLGEIEYSVQYSKENGFDGYETHMRSSFQSNDLIFIGTIEGLYMINPKIFSLSFVPPPPLISINKLKNAKDSKGEEELIQLHFVSVNPKFKGVKYSYRLKGKVENWTSLSKENEIFLTNLNDKDYIFEVKSSYDGVHFSEISSLIIKNNLPFWKSNWFLILIILVVAFVNLYFLDKTKSFTFLKNVEVYDVEISNLTRTLFLLFGWISTTFIYYFSSNLDKTIINNYTLNAFLSFLLLLLCGLSFVHHPWKNIKNNSLKIAVYLVIIHAYLCLYISNIHPYYLIILCLCSAIIPLAIKNLSELIIFSSLQIIISCSFVYLLENTFYDKILFLLAVIVSLCISIFSTYIRNESLHKLLFVTFLINKGKFFAFSFDDRFKIKFLSESFIALLGNKSINLFNSSISELNQFIDKKSNESQIFNQNIIENKKIIVAFQTKLNKLIWIEWTIYRINKNQHVLLGQNISKQIIAEKQNTLLYESKNELVFEVDIYGNIINSNSFFKKFFGFNEQTNKISSFMLLMPNEKESIKSFYEKQFKEKTLETTKEVFCIDKNGEKKLIELNSHLIFEEENTKHIKKFLCRAKDLSSDFYLLERNNQLQKKYNILQNSLKELITVHKNNEEVYQAEFEQFEKILFNQSEIMSDFYHIEKTFSTVYMSICSFVNSPIQSSFVSALICGFLNQIIQTEKVEDSGNILIELEKKCIHYLTLDYILKNKLELEIQIIQFDKKNKNIKYSTAGGQFLSNRSGDIIVQKGETKRLFELPHATFSKYHTYELKFHKTEYMILISGGFFNGQNFKENKKVDMPKLISFFKENKNSSINEQLILLKTFTEKSIKFDLYPNNFFIVGLKF
ncbi:MAG: PAS domain S-box protein [Flavobacteriia bacterium]|nr:PAS domain S-box protein [Flavobacteriia bacterium]